MLDHDEPLTTSTAKTKRPGTWHEGEPDVAVPRSTAVEAWESVAVGILKTVAANYNETITYGELKDQLFDQTGYRTRQLVSNWIAPVLGEIQRDTQSQGLPPLTSLVVDATSGQVGSGYITHGHLDGFEDAREREETAATDRLACYRTYAADVPANAQPQLTERYRKRLERDRRAARLAVPEPAACPSCWVRLPHTGVCDSCG